MREATRTALVTGANRGIGLEVARQLGATGMNVVVAGRSGAAMRETAEELSSDGIPARAEVVDAGSHPSIVACAARLAGAGLEIDVLVNNAALYPPGGLLGTSPEVLEETFAVNVFGPFWLAQAFVGGMLERGYGRIVNVSSGSGSFDAGLPGPGAYAVSKAALNALTFRLASEVTGDVKINAASPGWVRTRMGGPGAPRSAKEAAEGIVWLATLPADGPSGKFFRDRSEIAW
jgi:NAD(P)-dependent dehydrogenase (short-subunit alcohol dehydrogenase family)